jgi:hypothetical protein
MTRSGYLLDLVVFFEFDEAAVAEGAVQPRATCSSFSTPSRRNAEASAIPAGFAACCRAAGFGLGLGLDHLRPASAASPERHPGRGSASTQPHTLPIRLDTATPRPL